MALYIWLCSALEPNSWLRKAESSRNAQLEENNNRQLTILQEKIDSIGGKVAQKVDERSGIGQTISRPILSVYERVRKGKGGAAVIVVKKRACGACYKALTPKKVQEVKRADRIHTCDNCGRLLFWSMGTSD